VKQPEKYTLKEALPAYENLFLLKAFTKRYGMAGIRLGYGLSDNKALLEKMEAATQPWNVSGVAQAAGVAALGEEAFVQTARKLIFQEANILKKELQALGYRVYPSSANYIFFRGEEDLFEKCVAKGILIRDCSNYEGLTAGYYRIAVKTLQENEKLLKALREIKRG
jgi:threonine-phosphate decarboxylase